MRNRREREVEGGDTGKADALAEDLILEALARALRVVADCVKDALQLRRLRASRCERARQRFQEKRRTQEEMPRAE